MKSNVPKLRFNGFSDEWESVDIGTITTKVGSGKTPKGGDAVYTDEGVMFLRSQNVYNGRLYLENVAYITEEENNKMKSTKVYDGDILLNITGASIGRSCIVPKGFESANLNQHVCIIRLKENYDETFIMNQIIADKVQKQIQSYQAGGNREGLNFVQIKGMSIGVTELEEQKKIAGFLTKVDSYIEKQEDKVKNLESYKKGMMQKIFRQEIRFKDEEGRDYPEWEVSNLKTLCEINPKNKGLPQKFKYIDLESIVDGLLINDKEILLSEAPSRAQRLLEVGDVLFQTVRPYQMNNYMFNRISEMRSVASTGYAQLRVKDGLSNNKFIYQLIHNKNFNNDVMLRCTGTSYPAINSSELEIIPIMIPALEEQIKIANFLSNLDAIIEKEKQKLENLKTWKKGLLQQMFV